MGTEASKLELIQLILNIESSELISRFSDFLKRESKDFWDELSERERREIKTGLGQLNRDERIDFDEFIKKVS